MPRANRHYIPGQVWHITHRCHKKEFLLKFRRDRQRWQHWLFEAKKRYGLQVLNYIVTSNHIHLLTIDDGNREVLPRSLQLIASRTGQEYNQRKNRQGAFWEDRYHATAIESGEHFIRCMDIDMNMVRAGVVNHPTEWPDCGYHEIQDPHQRYTIVNRQKLAEVAMLSDVEALKESHIGWLHEMSSFQSKGREDKWSASIAVGGEKFVSGIKQLLGGKAAGRKVVSTHDGNELREPLAPYNDHFMPESAPLSPGNMHYWDIYQGNSVS